MTFRKAMRKALGGAAWLDRFKTKRLMTEVSRRQGCNSVFDSGCDRDELGIKIFGKDQDLNSPLKP